MQLMKFFSTTLLSLVLFGSLSAHVDNGSIATKKQSYGEHLRQKHLHEMMGLTIDMIKTGCITFGALLVGGLMVRRIELRLQSVLGLTRVQPSLEPYEALVLLPSAGAAILFGGFTAAYAVALAIETAKLSGCLLQKLSGPCIQDQKQEKPVANVQ